MDRKLFVSDIDGTLVTSNGIVSYGNKEAIKAFIAKGHKFTLATGRGLIATQQIINQITINAPLILFNGSLIYDVVNHKVIYEKSIHQDIKQDLLAIKNVDSEMGIEIHTIDDYVIYAENDLVIEHAHKQNLPINNYTDNNINDNWIKVLYISDEEKIDNLYNYVIKEQNNNKYQGLRFVKSTPRYLECFKEGIDKGKALKILQEYEKINDKDVYAIGDYYNDLELLQASHTSICVNNAPEDIKRIVDIVTNNTCSEDGFKEAIDKICSCQ